MTWLPKPVRFQAVLHLPVPQHWPSCCLTHEGNKGSWYSNPGVCAGETDGVQALLGNEDKAPQKKG